MKIIRTKKEAVEDSGEFISLEWASQTSAEYLDLLQGYVKCCSLSEDVIERKKYYDSAMEALGKVVVSLEMVGMLAPQENLFETWFGEDLAACCELVELEER